MTSLLTGVSEGRWNRLTPEEDMLPGSAQVTDSRSTDGCGDDGGGSQEPYEEAVYDFITQMKRGPCGKCNVTTPGISPKKASR